MLSSVSAQLGAVFLLGLGQVGALQEFEPTFIVFLIINLLFFLPCSSPHPP